MVFKSAVTFLPLVKSGGLRLNRRVRRDSNPRPAALETAALPAELHTHTSDLQEAAATPSERRHSSTPLCESLLYDLRDGTGTDSTAPFTDREAHT